MADMPSFRLPRTVVPERYEIEIRPDLDAATFTGSERVQVSVHEPVDEIVLNAAELEITSAQVEGPSGVVAATPEHDEAQERVVLRLAETVPAGGAVVSLRFAGSINDKLRGFYRSTFKDDDGRTATIATTQFEATSARRAFPCWDEPDAKAVFSISLLVGPGLSAFSNSPEEAREQKEDGSVLVRFADTMPMSTYLVAYVVGPLEATEPVDVDGVELRVVHVPGKGHMCDFALETGAHALRFFSEWFGIDYPAPKLDLVALPDFAFGAMENMGCVTFREQLLLVDRERATRVELERIADVVSHEIAHMWFGDLVTMKWWNGIWLNEAFATFMEMLAVDHYRPDWNRWVSFGLARGAAMSVDALVSTRPIEYPVADPAECEGMFDVLTYEKGAGVVRMLERYLGAEPFRSGIRRYMDAHQYANTETTDLWDAIEDATGEPARSTMDSWIFQEGYPLVSVEATDTGLELSQSRFLYKTAEGSARWSVPVLVRASRQGEVSEHRSLLTGDSGTLDLGGRPDWAVVNAGGSGFYRVRYSAELAAALTTRMAQLEPLERFNLVSDSWAATVAGITGPAEHLRVLGGLAEETDPSVWSAALSSLEMLHRVAGDADRPAVEAFVRRLAGPVMARTGWEPRAGEAATTGTLRATLVGALGTIGADEDVRSRAAEVHARALADGTSVDPDLAGAAVGVVAWTGGEQQYEAFLERYRNPSTPQEEVRYLYSLASFPSEALVARTLEMSLGEVRSQNAAFLVGHALTNRVAGRSAWRFVQDRWDALVERLPANSVVRMLEGLSALCTQESAQEATAFFATHPVPSGEKTLAQILERQAINASFADRVSASLGEALRA
ncbi:MAG TPA: M1 family metallopeptidase [Acidimicrobiales bacterium]|nr:M1 family metallopeptidase [Acidimicrobiales bacterium]